MADDKVHEIPLDRIGISETNVRQHDKDKELDDLAASIERHGLIQPVVLRGEFDPNPQALFELVVGQRRYMAHKKLGKKTIRATFAGHLSDLQARVRSLAENMHRVQLTYGDAADVVTDLYKHYKADERRVADETGMSLRKVRQYIYIEACASDETKKKLKSGKVRPADAQRTLMAAVGDKKKADELLGLMDQYSLTTYQKKRMVEYGAAHPRAPVEKLVVEAKREVVEQSLMVNLPDKVHEALLQAMEALRLSREEVAVRAISEWLSDKGFRHD